MISAKCIRRWRHTIDDKSDIVRQEAGYDVHEREGGKREYRPSVHDGAASEER